MKGDVTITESLAVIYHPAKFGGQRNCVGGDMFIYDILGFVKYLKIFLRENVSVTHHGCEGKKKMSNSSRSRIANLAFSSAVSTSNTEI